MASVKIPASTRRHTASRAQRTSIQSLMRRAIERRDELNVFIRVLLEELAWAEGEQHISVNQVATQK